VVTFFLSASLEIGARRGENQTFEPVESTAAWRRRTLVDFREEWVVRVDSNDDRTTRHTHSIELGSPDRLVFKTVSQSV